MLDGISAAGLMQGGAVGLLAIVFLFMVRSVTRGDWRTDREFQELRADRDARLADKDKVIADKQLAIEAWREAHATSELARERQGALLSEVVDGFRTVENFFITFRNIQQAEERSGAGERRGSANA